MGRLHLRPHYCLSSVGQQRVRVFGLDLRASGRPRLSAIWRCACLRARRRRLRRTRSRGDGRDVRGRTHGRRARRFRYGFYFHPSNINVANLGTYFSLAEVRGTWVLGSHPLTRFGVHPYSFLGLGLADFSARVPTAATVTDINGPQAISAWRVAGPGFVSTGVGVRIGNARFAVMIAPLKLALPFGSGTALAYMPEIAFVDSLF